MTARGAVFPSSVEALRDLVRLLSDPTPPRRTALPSDRVLG
jgi:hypothetical protein